jgi:hypothetical protein
MGLGWLLLQSRPPQTRTKPVVKTHRSSVLSAKSLRRLLFVQNSFARLVPTSGKRVHRRQRQHPHRLRISAQSDARAASLPAAPLASRPVHRWAASSGLQFRPTLTQGLAPSLRGDIACRAQAPGRLLQCSLWCTLVHPASQRTNASTSPRAAREAAAQTVRRVRVRPAPVRVCAGRARRRGAERTKNGYLMPPPSPHTRLQMAEWSTNV